jgi:hypothetical protein
MTDALAIWTLYDHPADMPDFPYVARLFEVDSNGVRAPGMTLWSEDLEELRASMRARGLTCLTRRPEDDSKIIEVWL